MEEPWILSSVRPIWRQWHRTLWTKQLSISTQQIFKWRSVPQDQLPLSWEVTASLLVPIQKESSTLTSWLCHSNLINMSTNSQLRFNNLSRLPLALWVQIIMHREAHMWWTINKIRRRQIWGPHLLMGLVLDVCISKYRNNSFKHSRCSNNRGPVLDPIRITPCLTLELSQKQLPIDPVYTITRVLTELVDQLWACHTRQWATFHRLRSNKISSLTTRLLLPLPMGDKTWRR